MTNIENFTIDFKAQGVTGVLDLAEMHANTVTEFLRYGGRRKIQDKINSDAKSHRDRQAEDRKNGAPVAADYDAEAEVAAMVVHFKAGTLPARGEGITSHETEMFRLAYAAFKDKHGKDKAKALREKIPAEVRIILTAFMGKGRARYFDDATESLKRKALEAKAAADRMAELANDTADDDDFDLAEFDL